MKKRKNFTSIVVDDKQYSYSISVASHLVVVYDEDDKKHERPFLYCRKDHDGRGTWRGKYVAGAYGKYEVSLAIRNYQAAGKFKEVPFD